MAYSFASASSQGLRYNYGVNLNVPFTIMAWIKPTTLANCALNLSGTAQSGYSLNITAAGNVNATHQNSSGSSVTATSVVGDNMAAGVWTHIAGVFTSSVSRQSFCNGNPGTVAATSLATQAITEIDLAFKYNSSSVKVNFFNGLICEVLFVNAAMSAAAIKGIANGGFPYRVGSNTKSLFRCICPQSPKTPWGSVSNSIDLIAVGSPTFTNIHAPVSLPRFSRILAA